MSLEIVREQQRTVGIIADRRLYVTADRSRLVEDGDGAAAFLLAPPGTEIDPTDVKRLGLVVVDGKVTQAPAEAAAPIASAEAPAAEATPPAPARGGSRRGGR
jgi:hypothetical protein